MEILIDNSIDFVITDKYMKIIEDVIKESLKLENFSENVEISVLFVDNEQIREINRKHRNIDRPTDVISFPLLDFESQVDFSQLIALGDIVISIEKVKEQAKEYMHSFEREFGFMFAHSMLHLLGYDHCTEPEEKIMFSKQEAILNNAGLYAK